MDSGPGFGLGNGGRTSLSSTGCRPAVACPSFSIRVSTSIRVYLKILRVVMGGGTLSGRTIYRSSRQCHSDCGLAFRFGPETAPDKSDFRLSLETISIDVGFKDVVECSFCRFEEIPAEVWRPSTIRSNLLNLPRSIARQVSQVARREVSILRRNKGSCEFTATVHVSGRFMEARQPARTWKSSGPRFHQVKGHDKEMSE